MTRPMPGPPQWLESAGLGDWDADDRWRNRWNLHWEDGRAEFDVLERHDKRLTDAECEREWEAFEQDASTALLLHTLGDKRVPAWRFKRFNHGANTWRRFATHPHALEEA